MVESLATMANEDDEVVKEIDVYISKALAENLYLFQYPLRPASMTYDDVHHLGAKVKPAQQKVELEMSINTNSKNYDRSKGEQIAINVDGGMSNEEPYFESSMMDKQVMTSTRALSSASNYAIGLLRPGELHLTPLHAVVQMKPSFSYLDKSDTQAKLDNKVSETDADDLEAEEPAKAVTVRFANQETEKIKQARERSYAYLQQQMASEPWIPVNFHAYGTDMTGVEASRLLCPEMDKDNSELPGTEKNFFESLVKDNVSLLGTTHCMSFIKHQPVQDQIRALMISAKVLQFSKLLSLLPPLAEAQTVLRFLQQVAMLVQGCWVVKSELLYPKDTFSPLSGIPADILCRARDYVMFRYTQSRLVLRPSITEVVKIPEEDLKMILNQMAKFTPQGWEFLLPTDMQFLSKFPEAVQRQQMLWDNKQQHLSRMFKSARQEVKGSSDSVMQSPSRPRQRRRTRSRQESISDAEGCSSDAGDRSDIESPKLRKDPKSPVKLCDTEKAELGFIKIKKEPKTPTK